MSICLQECLLQYILGIVVILSDLFGHPEHTAIIVLDQFRKCRGIPGLGASDQGGFIESRRCGNGTHWRRVFLV